jgi:hypothetical protein
MSADIPMSDTKTGAAPPYAAVGPAQSAPTDHQNESAYSSTRQGHEG